MKINHRGGDIEVTELILNGSNIDSFFKKMCGKGMPECITGSLFTGVRFRNCLKAGK